MEQLTYRFSLDTHKNGVQRTLQGFETGDGISRKLVINLVEEDRPFMLPFDNVVATMYVKRPSQSSPSINTCSINGDQIVYELTDSDLEEAGIVTCQLKLIFGTIEHPLNVIVSPRFDIEVWESMASDSVAEDTQEYTALEAALAKAQMCYEGRIISFSIDDSTGVLTVVYGYDEETQTHVTYTSDYFKDNLTPTIEVGTVTEGDVMSVTNSGTALHAIFDFILKKGEKGDDGFSAVANVVKSGDTATITITDKTGTTTAEISDGADGQDGQDGQDGYSPSASVTKSGDTATITITDKNGTTTAEISDGVDGQDGQDGADGYSPTATVVKNGSTATITITDKNGTTTASVSDGTGTTTSWNQIQTTGTKIAEITINGTVTEVKVPQAQGGHTYVDSSGTEMTARSKAKYIGTSKLEDDSVNNTTKIKTLSIVECTEAQYAAKSSAEKNEPTDFFATDDDDEDFNLGDLNDMNLGTPQAGDYPAWNANNSKYELVHAHGLKEIWANPNPTSSFAAQTITLYNLDVTHIDAIEIEWATKASEQWGAKPIRYEKSALVNNVLNCDVLDPWIDGNLAKMQMSYRQFTLSLSGTTLTITFQNALLFTIDTYGSSAPRETNNAFEIPVRILGLIHND